MAGTSAVRIIGNVGSQPSTFRLDYAGPGRSASRLGQMISLIQSLRCSSGCGDLRHQEIPARRQSAGSLLVVHQQHQDQGHALQAALALEECHQGKIQQGHQLAAFSSMKALYAARRIDSCSCNSLVEPSDVN